jgi:hypothetical protein
MDSEYVFLRAIAHDDQRLWVCQRTGDLYLADQSGDGRCGGAGRPDETDDGPLRVVSRVVHVHKGRFTVRVVCERQRGRDRFAMVGVTREGAAYLNKEHGFKLSLTDAVGGE